MDREFRNTDGDLELIPGSDWGPVWGVAAPSGTGLVSGPATTDSDLSVEWPLGSPASTAPMVAARALSRVILIDLDNCPGELLRIAGQADERVRVIGCHGAKEPHVGLGLVPRIAELMSTQRLQIVSMRQGGKNAADFGLTFWGGWLAGQLPPETEFVVVSNDTDLDHLVSLLVTSGRRARRMTASTQKVTTLTTAPSPTATESPPSPKADVPHPTTPPPRPAPTSSPAAPTETSVEAAVNKFISTFAKSTNRPKKLPALKNCLKSHGQTLSPNLIDKIVRRLVERQVVAISDETVTYRG